MIIGDPTNGKSFVLGSKRIQNRTCFVESVDLFRKNFVLLTDILIPIKVVNIE